MILRDDDDGHFLSSREHPHPQFFFIGLALLSTSVEQLEKGVEGLVGAAKAACL